MAFPRLAPVWPGVVAAFGFGISNVLAKLAFAAGADALALLVFRGVVGIGFLAAWLRLRPPAGALAGRPRWIALGLGVLFAGNVYGLFSAIRLIPVPVAVLAYFAYPLLTGIVGGLSGIERLTWRGGLSATVALGGLALMIGGQGGAIDPLGLGFAFLAAGCRTALLLVTRVALPGVESRLTTWYTLLSSTGLLALAALLADAWAVPATGDGWAAFLATSVTTTIGIMALFASTGRIGPFRTALLMNLEPAVSMALGALLLGETIGPLQALGAVVMIGALMAFQLRR